MLPCVLRAAAQALVLGSSVPASAAAAAARPVGMQASTSGRWSEACSFASATLASGVSSASSHRGDPTGPPAFVFDIDGVLVRGSRVLPTAKQAMAKLCPAGAWAYPVCFLTNGGGMLEADKALQLTNWLGVPVTESQVIMSHTPMRQLVPQLQDRPVLVSGRGRVLEVARRYGFQRVLSTFELGRAMPAATPFSLYPESAGDEQLAGPCPVRDLGLGTEASPIEAVLVMHDPDDWYRDLQLIVDVLLSGGVPERKAGPPAGTAAVQLYFSNPDLLWANEFPRARFGQGAFAHAVKSLCVRVSDVAPWAEEVPLHVKFFGKPNPEPYRLAERLLLHQARKLGLGLEPGPSTTSATAPDVTPAAGALPEGGGIADPTASALPQLPFSGIYAVGDNPAADVRGANAAGPPWVSVLVQTGVFQGPGVNCSVDTAQIAVPCVAAAVDAALHRSRSSRWHSMR